jgi:ribosome biogenesis GTPase
MPSLEAYGWNPFFADSFAAYASERLVPGRVARDHQHIYRVYMEAGEVLARVAGRLRHHAAGAHEFPAVGDWVAIELPAQGRRGIIHAVLPRRTKFSRKVAGDVTQEQVIAANIDTVFLAQGLDGDYNLRRVERYLFVAWNSGARPVIILNKADVCENVAECVREVERVAAGTPIHVMSARLGDGIDQIRPYLKPGETAALLGSSGVGKSTLINRLIGEERLRTGAVRASDSRGRHVTTARELILLPGGGLIIDTPGLRELQLWDAGAASMGVFGDIDVLSLDCHFRDCRHEQEPGCAVRLAVEEGRLDLGRLENYVKLRSEAEYLANREDVSAQQAVKQKWRAIHRAAKKHKPRE